MNVSPRVLKEAKAQARQTATRLMTFYTRKQISSWADVERLFHITVPDGFKATPWNYANLSLFARQWELGFEARLAASLAPRMTREDKAVIDKNVSTFGDITLFPEQQGCFKKIYQRFITDKVRAIYQDGHTGSGKTYIACAVIAQMIKDGILNRPDVAWRPHPFMIFTPKGVMEHWKRALEECGLGEYVRNRKIYVISESELATEFGDMFAHEVEDHNTGDVTMTWTLTLTPILVVLDEAHHYINPDAIRTKKILALGETKLPIHFLLMSATPAEKINDSYVFACLCNTRFMDMAVNKETFKQFAGLLDSTPEKPNREAVKRLRSVLGEYIVSIPYVKPKFKAINVVQLVEFKSETDWRIYNSAHERYIQACLKSGKNTMWGRFEKFIALNNYRKTVEPLRAWYLAHRCAENYHAGTFATAVGCAFKETITETAFQLIDKYNIPRSAIAIVWGGKRQYKTEELLSRPEIEKVLANTDPLALLKDRSLLKRVRLTLKYFQDQHEHDETPEEQAYRHNRLAELKLLGKQGDNARQIEIDNFQDGTAKICLFTIASGGVGLSFDRNKESLLPREGLFTPVYSGKEFQQLLGRLVRRASLSDAIQRICMMQGTVEESHVAPILDEKLKCIAEITNRNFDIINLLESAQPIAVAPPKLRDVAKAADDAAKDDTVIADFHSDEEETDDDEGGDDSIIPI